MTGAGSHDNLESCDLRTDDHRLVGAIYRYDQHMVRDLGSSVVILNWLLSHLACGLAAIIVAWALVSVTRTSKFDL
jgi:hypothetical protein